MMYLSYFRVNKYLVFSMFLSFFSVFNSPISGQVKRYSKVKKRIKNTFNFEKGVFNITRQNRDRRIYKVFSARADNLVYLDPYSQKEGEKQGFLDPYYVLDEKNNFLEVVKADVGILGKPKGIFSFLFGKKYNFKDTKNVNYVGWIHKDRIIDYDHPKLSNCNYKPLRYVIGVQSVNVLYNSSKYMEKDTVYLFENPLLKEKIKKTLKLNEFVFLYKYSVDKKAVLVSNLDNLKLKDSISRTMGWIPSFLLKNVGQQQVYAIDKVDYLTFSGKTNNSYECIRGNEVGGKLLYDTSRHHKRPKRVKESTILTVPLSVWNHQDNKLINVDGVDVLINKLNEIKEDNKLVNFHFIFDCGKALKKKQLLLMSSLQNIWMLTSSIEKYKGYEFTFSASSYGCGKFYKLPKTGSFSVWIDYLQSIFSGTSQEDITDINTQGISECFSYAIKDLPKQSFTNNIILVSGEKRFFLSSNIKEITQELGETSSRVIFYQLENKVDDQHQDYILQAKDILRNVSDSHTNFIRSFIVENELIKSENTFTNITGEDNIFLYDAPLNSTYQGGLVFPKINKVLSGTSFDKALDSVFSKTLQFNKIFTGSLEYHAERLGFLRSKSSEKIKAMILQDSTYAGKLGMLPRNYMHENYYTNKRHRLKDNPKTVLGYLLSKEEFKLLIDGYKSLIPMYYKAINRRERRHLSRIYLKNKRLINKNLFRRILRRKNYLADLLFIKTGMPVKSSFLQSTKIRHIRRKRRTSHVVFAEIMRKLRLKIDVLEEILSKKNTNMYKDGSKKEYYFISNDQII